MFRNHKRWKELLVCCVALFMFSCTCRAANENAKRDGNHSPTMIGVATSTGFIKNVAVDSSGDIYVAIATGTITAVNTIATGTINVGNTLDTQPLYTTTFDYSVASTTYTSPTAATGTISAATTSESFILTNESSTATIRFCVGCTLDVTCTSAAPSGLPLIAGAYISMSGVNLTGINWCAPTGGPVTISAQWGRMP